MNPSFRRLALLSLCAVPLFGNGTTTVDDFEGPTNLGGWTFNVTTREIREPAEGNPGGWLRNTGIISFAPILASSGSSPFTGDFRAANVTRISIDARTDAASVGAAGRQLSLVLRDTKGTPLDPADDDYAYSVGATIPQVGEGWVHYDFDVPSAVTVPVPAGWSGGYGGDLENFRPGVDWNDVIARVDSVEFWWLDPSFFAVIQLWEVGVDNVTLRTGDALAIPRNGSGVNPTTLAGITPPVLGGTLQVRLDCSAHAPGLGIFLMHAAPMQGVMAPPGEVLIDLSSPRLFSRVGAHQGGTIDQVFAVPNDPALCGFAAHLQAACGPGLQLSNALDLVVGR